MTAMSAFFFGDYGRRGDSPWDAGLGEDRARGTIMVVLMDWEAGGALGVGVYLTTSPSLISCLNPGGRASQARWAACDLKPTGSDPGPPFPKHQFSLWRC